MPLDKSLNLATSKKPKAVDRKFKRRERLMLKVAEQIAILEKIQAGEQVSRDQRRTAKWWWTENNAYFLSVMYTRKPLELAKGKWSIQCKDIAEVITALKSVNKSVEDGDFDVAMESLAQKASDNFKKSAG